MKIKKLQIKRIASRFRDLYELMYKRQNTQGKTLKKSYERACSDHLRTLEIVDPDIFSRPAWL